MRKELVAKLIESYPEMFPGDSGPLLGISCGDGWFDLVNRLCCEIQQDVNQRLEPADPVVVIQIKQKFGGLRFYYSGGSPFVSGLVHMSHSMSYFICEECGNRGERMVDINRYETVSCEIHAPKNRLSPEELKRIYGPSE